MMKMGYINDVFQLLALEAMAGAEEFVHTLVKCRSACHSRVTG